MSSTSNPAAVIAPESTADGEISILFSEAMDNAPPVDEPSANGDGKAMPPKARKSKAKARKRKSKLRPVPNSNDHFPLTDTGLAERFADLHGPNVRFCHPWKKWLVWDGQRWRIDDTGATEYLAKRTARWILTEASQEEDKSLRSALIDFAKAAESATRRSAMVRLAQSEPGLPILPTELDQDPWLLNCQNGTLNLKTAELRRTAETT